VSQRQYEILFIAEQNLGEAEVDTLTATVKGFIEKENGTVEKVEKWGKKRLAYPIGKNREGSYVLMIANAPGSSIRSGPSWIARSRRIRRTTCACSSLASAWGIAPGSASTRSSVAVRARAASARPVWCWRDRRRVVWESAAISA